MTDDLGDLMPVEPPPDTPIAPCPVCGTYAAAWERSEGGKVEFAIHCMNTDMINNYDCLLEFPPENFYRDDLHDAILYWNTWAALRGWRDER
jgi:hypothetical protein